LLGEEDAEEEFDEGFAFALDAEEAGARATGARATGFEAGLAGHPHGGTSDRADAGNFKEEMLGALLRGLKLAPSLQLDKKRREEGGLRLRDVFARLSGVAATHCLTSSSALGPSRQQQGQQAMGEAAGGGLGSRRKSFESSASSTRRNSFA